MAKSPTVHRRRGAMVALTTICAIVTAIVIWIVFIRLPTLTAAVNTGNNRLESVTTLGAQNQAKLKALGQKPVGPPAGSVSAGKATPPPTRVAPITPGPTYEQSVTPSQTAVNTAVETYFERHPPKLPFTTQDVVDKLVPFVTKYLREHPAPAGRNGKDGKNGITPTEQQVDTAVQTFLPAAVAAYLAENPPPSGAPGPSGASGEPGPSGATGPEGRGPTQEEIADAVANYFSAHPLACPDGYTATTENITTTGGVVLVYVCVANEQPSNPPTEPTP